MAEGRLHDPRGNSRMEDVGDEYFQELLSRSFLQISSGNKSSFVMHDLVSHFAVGSVWEILLQIGGSWSFCL